MFSVLRGLALLAKAQNISRDLNGEVAAAMSNNNTEKLRYLHQEIIALKNIIDVIDKVTTKNMDNLWNIFYNDDSEDEEP